MQHPRRRPILAALVSALALTAATSLPAQRGYHVDARVGFKVKLPAAFRPWPAEKDRQFVTGHYVSTKTFPIPGTQFDHRPTMRVVVLPKPGVDGRPAEPAGDAKPREPVEAVDFYADYKDYLARNLSGSLVHKSDEKGAVGGVPCRKLLVRRRANDREYEVTAWCFDLESHTVAVEFLVLAEHAAKIRPQVQAALTSFKTVPVDRSHPVDAPWSRPVWVREPERWKTLSANERLRQRIAWQDRFLASVRESASGGFKARDTKFFLVLSNANPKYTAEVARAADACHEWCVAHFDSISDETVTKCVIRVFESQLDYWVYRARSAMDSHYVPSIHEIVFAPGRRQPRELTGLEDLTEGILHHVLHDKDPALYRNLPDWLREGLTNYLRLSKLEPTRLTFEPSDFEKSVVREERRAGSLETPQRIVTEAAVPKDEDDRRLRYQRGRIVRFVLQSATGHANAWPDNFLVDYLVAVRAALADHGVPAPNPGAGHVPGSSEDQQQKRSETRRKTRRKLLEVVNTAVCKLGDAGWATIQKAYDAFNKDL